MLEEFHTFIIMLKKYFDCRVLKAFLTILKPLHLVFSLSKIAIYVDVIKARDVVKISILSPRNLRFGRLDEETCRAEC